MKRKQKIAKLKIARETLARLEEGPLQEVAGGLTPVCTTTCTNRASICGTCCHTSCF
jgi:hypothetical protein